jgi:valyl-tRNA synthetase
MGIEKKLTNEKFVSNAPAKVIEKERKKLADNQAKVALLQENLAKIQ